MLFCPVINLKQKRASAVGCLEELGPGFSSFYEPVQNTYFCQALADK